ncbi:MAG: hydrogenase iron-sulfur subunit [Burkholderiales bacterium]
MSGDRRTGAVRRAVQAGFATAERAFDRPFGAAANPWRHLGALGFLLFWIVAATGVYVYVGYDSRVDGAYASVAALSSNAFPLGSLARSLHRYASDAFVVVVLAHLAREWAFERYAHFRRFSWLTGVALLWLAFASGIGGFWLVWDRIAQYSLIATAEWLDVLPVFNGALVRNFIAADAVSDRLFSLLVFLHIGFPLALLALMWIHLQRLAHPRTNPPRALGWGTAVALALLSVMRPVASDAPADLATAPGVLALDWFYLGAHAFADVVSPAGLWLAAGALTLWLLALAWWSGAARRPRPAAAVVDLANCNGCGRCFADCPYAAVTMTSRTDGKALPRQATVDPALCAGCGICAGACPSSSPFRSVLDLVTGIDLPQAPVHALRAVLDGALTRFGTAAPDPARPRVVVFACDPDGDARALMSLADERTAVIGVLCAAQVPPSFVEFALRSHADGVLVTGCRTGDCAHRLGDRWTRERMTATREPHLRPVVPRDRVRLAWASRRDAPELAHALAEFRASLALALPAHPTHVPPKRIPGAGTAARTA